MIDFYDYQLVKLEDVAEFGRAKEGHIYPAGSSTIQISASRGQIGFLKYPSRVKTKDVVIIPSAGIYPQYFNIILQKNVEKFMRRYATGINIQEKEIGNFPIELHNQETQKAIAEIISQLDTMIDEQQKYIDTFSKTKKSFLQKMMI